MREAVSESEQPGDALLDRQGQLGHAAPGDEGLPPVEAAVPVGARRHHVEVLAMYQFRDDTAARLGLDLIVHQNPECVARGINPFDHGSATAHRHVEDRGPQAGHRRAQVRPVLRRRPARRGEVAGQGADLLGPLGAAPVGSEAPAARAVVRSTTPVAATARRCGCSRSRTGPNSTCGSTSTSSRSRSCRSTSPRRARSSTATAC